jgi:hypothetical protein
VWCRTATKGTLPKPPYFDVIAEYYKRRKMMEIRHGPDEPIHVQRNNVPFATTRLYRNHKGEPQTTSSISAECLKLLKASGAIPPNSNLKAKHIRHSVLSYANFVGKPQLQQAILRSRHEQSTFESTYKFRVDQESIVALNSLPNGASLDDILMG